MKATRRMAAWVCAGLVVGTTASAAYAQFAYTNDRTKPNDLIGFKYIKGPPATLSPVPDATALLGTLDTLGRWTTGDLDRDGKPEIILPFTVVAEQSTITTWTFDTATSYFELDSFVVGGAAGRQTTGDLDGDGRDELVLIDFGNATPAPRPPTGGTDVVRVVTFDSLVPMDFATFRIPQQFVTRNTQIVARDITGDRNAEILVLSQNEVGHNDKGEPIGGATLFACSPVLGTPSTCTQVLSVTVPASADGRYPTSIAVGDFDNDRLPDIAIGYGSSCQTTGLTVSLLNPRTMAFSGPFTLARPFQRFSADDLDRDGIPELVASVGGQAGGGAGALQVYHFDPVGGTFQLVTETPANVPAGDCINSPLPGVTFDPVAAVGLVPAPPAEDFCDGMDNDGDGQVDENCFLRFLFIPWCFTGDDAAFKAAVDRQFNFYMAALGMDVCPQNVYREYVPVGRFNLGACGDAAQFGPLRQTFVAAATAAGGPDINQFSAAVALSNDINQRGRFGGEYGGGDFLWVKHYPEGSLSGTGRIIGGVEIMAHELGHMSGLGEEYCREDLPPLSDISPGCHDTDSINLLEARLGCEAPPATTCCNTTDMDGFCEGNVPPGLPNGRCIMSHATAGRLPGETPAPRGYCENCINHLKQRPPTSGQPLVALGRPLDCASAYAGDGPLLDLTTSASPSGPSVVTAKFVDRGRQPLTPPRTSGPLLLTVADALGATIYQSAFHPQSQPTIPDGIDPGANAAPAPFNARIMLPPALDRTAPMPITVTRDGAVVTKVTLNGNAPTANAGADRTVECTTAGAGGVQLDGTGSSDPDGDTLSYVWTSTADVTFDNPASATPIARIPVGTRSIALEVTDGVLSSAPDFVQITVRDTAKPTFPATMPVVDASQCRSNEAVTLPLPPATDVCDPTLTITGVVIRSNGQNVNVTVPPDRRVVLAVGRHTVRWTARDDAGNTATADQFVDVRPAFLANGAIDFADRAQARSGSNYASLGNSGVGVTTTGVSAHTGDLLGRGNVFLRGTRVHGSVTTTGSITKQLGAVVDGQERPFTNPNLSVFTPPAVTFPAPTGDIIVPRNATQTASPGSYGRLSVDQGATLTLAAGDYYLERLVLEPTSRLVQAGSVRLFVKIELTHRGTFATVPAGGNTFIHYGGTQAGFLEAPYTGTVLAPQGRIVVRKAYTGRIAARDIQVEPDIVLQCNVPTPPIAFAGRGGAGLSAEVEVPAVAVETAGAGEASGDAPRSGGCSVAGAVAPGGEGGGGALVVALGLVAMWLRRRGSGRERGGASRSIASSLGYRRCESILETPRALLIWMRTSPSARPPDNGPTQQ